MHPSLWVREASPLAAESTPLPAAADVVILGGGVAGVCAALHLARGGARPLLLEARVVADRASGRNDGQVLLGLGEHYNRIVGQFGAAGARELWDFIRANNQGLRRDLTDHGIDCALVEAGGLRLAETEHEAAELAEAGQLMAAEGIDHQMLDAVALSEAFPGSIGFHGAMVLPGEACVQPAAMVRGLATLARREGAALHQDCPVAAVTGSMGDFAVHLADGRAVATPAVVHCTAALGRSLDGSGFLQRAVFPFRGQILATELLPAAVQARFPPHAMSSNFCYEYFRMHGGRFVIGGMRWSVKGEELDTTDDDRHNPEVSANLLAYVDRHFPDLRAVAWPHVWTGIMAGTKDGLPLVGPLPGQPGAFAYLGFNGYGLSFAWLGGQLLAQHVLEGAPRRDTATWAAAPRFDPRRFR